MLLALGSLFTAPGTGDTVRKLYQMEGRRPRIASSPADEVNLVAQGYELVVENVEPPQNFTPGGEASDDVAPSRRRAPKQD